MDFEVLILGSDVNAYYMARCTHEAYNKKAYMLIKDKLAFTTHSKIINHIYNDKIWNEKDFVIAINNFLDEHKDRKILVISSNETYAKYLVSNKDKFRKNIYFNYPSLNILDSLINKEKFYKEYSNSNLKFPKTVYYNTLDNVKLEDDFDYPVIVKPANVVMYNHISFEGKKKIYKLNNKDELLSTINLIKGSNYTDTLIIQEFIPGDDSHLFDAVVYSDKNGDVKLISFAQIGLQEHKPDMIGNATVLINGFNTFGVDTTPMVKSIKKFMNDISYQGYAEFDMKFDERSGEFKVLEINARQGRCSYYIAEAGFNLVKILVDDLINDVKMEFKYIDKKVMLSFVNKSIISKFIDNSTFKKEALQMYKESCNPLVYKKDWSFIRNLLYIKRNKNYRNSYQQYKW